MSLLLSTFPPRQSYCNIDDYTYQMVCALFIGIPLVVAVFIAGLVFVLILWLYIKAALAQYQLHTNASTPKSQPGLPPAPTLSTTHNLPRLMNPGLDSQVLQQHTKRCLPNLQWCLVARFSAILICIFLNAISILAIISLPDSHLAKVYPLQLVWNRKSLLCFKPLASKPASTLSS